ncbi:aminoglycoside phosphotransferase family protein [Amycolatopsis palatopharyngis]|uniref:aminoglycoside phosphotransferase family protein n=1 Tax=Amycolatopsis palatopharyngis TaxID=187982 RepID=UPI000E2562FC|nr:aminoglycoside phosphotransferase family protein [Amycolatopsis palatopharyngis]
MTALDPALVLDEGSRARLVDRFGAGVGPWCDALPDLVADLSVHWGLRLRSSVAGGTGRTFLGEDTSGAFVVLKVTPEREIAETEAAALRVWTGCSRVVNLLDTAPAEGALLLEGLCPATPLAERRADFPVPEIAELLGQLATTPVPASGFITLRERLGFIFDLFSRRAEGAGLSPAAVARSRTLAMELAADGPVRLLHGDLHPDNVLDAGPVRGAVAIDPRPCLGDPAVDAADWAVLPLLHGGSLDAGVSRLASAIPELDVERLTAWCRSFAVLLAIAQRRRNARASQVERILELVP